MNTDINGRKPYRFGNLKEALIEQGVVLVCEEGIEEFSLQKTAKKVGISAAACYNHFGNMNDLLREIYSYVIDRFAAALKRAVEDNPYHHVTILMGVAYVEFFAKYPHCLDLLFDSGYLGTQIKETEITWNNSFTPSEIFTTGAKRGVKELNTDEKELRDDLLVMWVAVHGLAAMASMKGVQYDSGDRGAFTERLLPSKVML